LTAVVGMADDGGSTGTLRDEYGVLPPGDIRQCLVALSNASEETRELINYRIPKGMSKGSGLSGHTLGNLLIASAQQVKGGDMNAALDMLGKTFDLRGQVVPATVADRRLRLTTVDGEVIDGEHTVEESDIPSLRGATVGFDKEPTPINERAEAAIKEADMVVIAPGDLYTSIAPALAVRGMREALKKAPGVVQVVNLMNRNRHTAGFTVSDYASETQRIAGATILSHVLYNSERPDDETLARYAGEGEYPVGVDMHVLSQEGYRALGRSLLSRTEVVVSPDDAIASTRSLIRHDPQKVAHALLGIYYGEIV
jgi:uncharacterized cofD-like protein